MEEYEMEDSILQEGETLEEYLSFDDSHKEQHLGELHFRIAEELADD